MNEAMERALDLLKPALSYSSELIMSKDHADEIIYGSAGYLNLLLQLKYAWDDALDFGDLYDITLDEKTSELNSLIEKHIKFTVTTMVSKMKMTYKNRPILASEWPKGTGKHYLGAGHGIIGILYQLIMSLEY